MFQCDISGKYEGGDLTITAPTSYEDDEMGFDDFTHRCVLAEPAAAILLIHQPPSVIETSPH